MSGELMSLNEARETLGLTTIGPLSRRGRIAHTLRRLASWVDGKR